MVSRGYQLYIREWQRGSRRRALTRTDTTTRARTRATREKNHPIPIQTRPRGPTQISLVTAFLFSRTNLLS